MPASSPLSFALALLLLGGWAALFACSPVATYPPPVPGPFDARAVDLTLSSTAYVRSAGRSSAIDDGLRVASRMHAAQLAYLRHLNSDMDLGLILTAAKIEDGFIFDRGMGGGLFFRHVPLNQDRLRLGYELEAGVLYGGLALPLTYELGERVWVTTAPRLRFGADNGLRLPLGFCVRGQGDWYVRGEAGLGTNPGLEALGYTEGQGVYGALGVTRSW
ncbi:MAG: hypothetical protein H6741_08585 [Alphaproteobacteria bacterium]|nr:hypothetical protein [Alphaproteobacteria bacterium]MCB9792774.1 hypothetical protein [Alphaproteobacteria bacterium]